MARLPAIAFVAAIASIVSVTQIHAQEHTGQEHKGHHAGDMHVESAKTEGSGVGVINAVDAAKGVINITHEPMPALGWPQMTMDLPVTNKVDLSSVKAGDKVGFTLKLGRDKQYRVIEMKAAQ